MGLIGNEFDLCIFIVLFYITHKIELACHLGLLFVSSFYSSQR